MTRALPVALACSISSAAAPSTQPPLTDPAIGRIQEDGALRARGGPERPDDDGAPDIGTGSAVGLPGSECVEQFLHRSGLGTVRSMVSPPTTEGGATTVGMLEPGSAAWAAASLPRRVSPARTPPRISPSRSSDATVPAGRKSSMYGYAARIPPASG